MTVVAPPAVRPPTCSRSRTVVVRSGDVLVDERGREPGEGELGPGDEDLGLDPGARLPADHVEDLLGQGRITFGDGIHPRTPTRTPRNRAGAAG